MYMSGHTHATTPYQNYPHGHLAPRAMFSSLKLHWALRRLSWHTSTPTSALRDRLVAMHQLLALHKEHQWNSIAHQVHPLADSSEVAKALRKNPRVHNVGVYSVKGECECRKNQNMCVCACVWKDKARL